MTCCKDCKSAETWCDYICDNFDEGNPCEIAICNCDWFEEKEVLIMKNKYVVNIKVEFEPRQIRHLAIECPECKNWFNSYDICDEDIRYNYQLSYNNCECPKCGCLFKTNNNNIQECSYEEVYKDVLEKKVEWVKDNNKMEVL